MATVLCRKRLQKELIHLQKNPVENIEALPNDKNILEWHYVITGPKDSPYYGGTYHGILLFPAEYPYKPPSITMCTRSGRFRPNTRLCLSMSDFHPETWNPMWSVSSIMSGLLSFMLENTSTVGSIESTPRQKQHFALLSMHDNLNNVKFCKLFPHLAKRGRAELKARAIATAAAAAAATTQKEFEGDADAANADTPESELRRRSNVGGEGTGDVSNRDDNKAVGGATQAPAPSVASQAGSALLNMFFVLIVGGLAVLSFMYV